VGGYVTTDDDPDGGTFHAAKRRQKAVADYLAALTRRRAEG
jgi:hypothetical protein